MPSAEFQHAMSRFARCTPGVVDRCVMSVASEVADLDQIIPGFSAREIALVARDALEALELEEQVARALTGAELVAGDWVRSILAEGRLFISEQLHRAGRREEGKKAYALATLALEEVAASSNRSPVLSYDEIFFEAAQANVRRGDRAGLARQIECLAEDLQQPDPRNVHSTLRMLAEFYIQLGDHRAGLALAAATTRHAPGDPWAYNSIALAYPRLGLPSLGRLAAERGLALLDGGEDPHRLRPQLRELLDEIGSKADRSDAPPDAVDDLRDALHTPFDAASAEPMSDFARRVVPEVITARVKALPPAPSPAELASIAERLRSLRTADRRAIAAPAPAREGPKVGRNEPCPCGSGKKYKKCCLP